MLMAGRVRRVVSVIWSALIETECGGNLTEVERGLIRQAAALTFKAESLQSDLVNGNPVDGDQLIRLTGTAKRILTRHWGEGQQARSSVGPSLSDYLARKATEKAAGASDGDAA